MQNANTSTPGSSNTETPAARTAIKALALAGVGALLGSRKAMAQDGGAGMIATFTAWVTDNYNKNATIINDGVRQVNSGVKTFERVTKAQDEIKATYQWANNFSDRFFAFARDPLGSTLPQLDLANAPIIRYLRFVEDTHARLFEAKKLKGDEPEAIKMKKSLRAETSFALAKEGISQTRNMLTAQKKNHANFAGFAGKTDKSHAQKFTEEMGPVLTEQNQLILESLHEIRAILLDFHRQTFGGEVVLNSKFDKSSVEKAKKDFKAGKGTVPQDE